MKTIFILEGYKEHTKAFTTKEAASYYRANGTGNYDAPKAIEVLSLDDTKALVRKEQGEGEITINEEQRLYVIPCAGGYSCLGFDVAFERATRYASELNSIAPDKKDIGTLAGYEFYKALVRLAEAEYKANGRKLKADLSPQLIGLEGKRVECERLDGEIIRFQVGKSTGWIPVHLELMPGEDGGGAADREYKSVQVLSR